MAYQSLSATDKLTGIIAARIDKSNSVYTDTGYIATKTRDARRLRLVKADGSAYSLSELAAGLGNVGTLARDVKVAYEYSGTTHTLKIPDSYKFNGVTVGSLLQLVIMVCLHNAQIIENDITSLMEVIAQNNNKLDAANTVCSWLLTCQPGQSTSINSNTTTTYVDADGVTKTASYYTIIVGYLGVASYTMNGTTYAVSATNWDYGTCQAILEAVNNKVDELNSLSQENMINLQALVDKRNQAYELSSNITKLFGTGFQSVARDVS